MVRKIEVLVMACLLIGIGGGIGLKHYIRTHRAAGTEIRINPPPDNPKPETQPAGTTNGPTAAIDTPAMNAN